MFTPYSQTTESPAALEFQSRGPSVDLVVGDTVVPHTVPLFTQEQDPQSYISLLKEIHQELR